MGNKIDEVIDSIKESATKYELQWFARYYTLKHDIERCVCIVCYFVRYKCAQHGYYVNGDDDA